VLLPGHLTALGYSSSHIGMLAGTALFGSALLTLAIGVLGARYEHRSLLIFTAGLMTLTGIAFSSTQSYLVLLLVALLGSVNPFASTASFFVPIEHAVFVREAGDIDRTQAFARYSLVGGLAGAVGAGGCDAPSADADRMAAVGGASGDVCLIRGARSGRRLALQPDSIISGGAPRKEMMAVINESERTAAASFTSVPRSLAASLSPVLAGGLFASQWAGAPLVICGSLKNNLRSAFALAVQRVEAPGGREHVAFSSDPRRA
jgi:hypothetical protein